MKNIAVINGINLADYAFEKLGGEDRCIDMVLRYARSLPGVETIVFLSHKPYDESFGDINILQEHWDCGVLLETLKKYSKNRENIFYFYGDAPLMDPELGRRMFENHKNYFAEYTFADGYPPGLTPEIINTKILNRLSKLIESSTQEPVKRDTFFEIIKKDINSFDIETEISPKDLRMLRLELFTDTKRNFELVNKVRASGGTNADSILALLEEMPSLQRTLPAFYNIQISAACPQKCSYCPYFSYMNTSPSAFGGKKELSPSEWEHVLQKISAFSKEGVVSFSLWGEPSCHSDIKSIFNIASQFTNFRFVVETSGIGWDSGLLEQVNRDFAPTWIVSLDSWEEQSYKTLRGEGYAEAVRTAELLLGIAPERTYVQAVRMVSNEDDLERFYDNWKQKTENLIIQKYDSFCGVLEDLKVTDLSPVKRFPCRHLSRDMNILLDGRVPVCREDLKGEYILGNIFHDTPEKIWSAGEILFQQHVSGNYNKLCKDCDEYYTFNF